MLLIFAKRWFPDDSFSWKECLLLTWASFKGPICLLLALVFASEVHRTDPQSIYQVISREDSLSFCSLLILVSNLSSNHHGRLSLQFDQFDVFQMLQ